MYMAYTADGVSTDTHVFRRTWQVVIQALIQRFLTKIPLQEAHVLVNRDFQRPDEDELQFET